MIGNNNQSSSGTLIGHAGYANYTYPYQPYTYPWGGGSSGTVYIGKSEPHFDYKIRKVENGFIVLHGHKEFAFNAPKDLADFLTKQLGE